MNAVIERRSGLIPVSDRQEPEWTQDEAIAYECAREAINDLIGIKIGLVRKETDTENPDEELVAKLEEEITRLSRERTRLRLKDHANITRIRSEYGAIIRAHYYGNESS